MSLCLKCISYKLHTVGFFFFIHSDNLCLLTGVFRIFTFDVIIDVVKFESITLLLFICPAYSLFPLSSFFSAFFCKFVFK